MKERETGRVRGDRRGCKRESRGEMGEMMEGKEEAGMGQRTEEAGMGQRTEEAGMGQRTEGAGVGQRTEGAGMGQRSCSVLVLLNICFSLPSLLLFSKMSQC